MTRYMVVLSGLLALCSCDVTDPFTLLRCEFRVESTKDFYLAGVSLDSLESLSSSQVAQVLAAWAEGECPMDFTLNVGIRNPNDSSSAGMDIPATLTDFGWDLYLDTSDDGDFDTTWVCSGSLGSPFEVPEGGETVILPLDVAFDAFALLGSLDPMFVIDLALAIGGIDSDIRDPQHLGRLYIKTLPEFDTPLGPITYPSELLINLDWAD
ncbi:hypothetical protein GF402_06540 [Candidatus Fermentibacteria bacterium]|nr:hypothetical protein [Candidatus Fermentibacteria bacterium]